LNAQIESRRAAHFAENPDKPMSEFLPWIKVTANEKGNGLTNSQRREWVRKEGRLLASPVIEIALQKFFKCSFNR
jgi:hypothetical protein